MLPEWEPHLIALEERGNREQADVWSDVVDIAAILGGLKPRTKLYNEAVAEIMKRRHLKRRTIQVYLQVWRRCIDPETGEVTLPLRIHWSTARHMVEKGATYEDLMTANDEGWSLAQARLWAQGRVRENISDKPLTLWRYLTKVVPPELRKRPVEAMTDLDRHDFVEAVKQALREAGRQSA